MPYSGGYPYGSEVKSIRGRYDFAVAAVTAGAFDVVLFYVLLGD